MRIEQRSRCGSTADGLQPRTTEPPRTTPTNTVAGELHQIQAYVQSTNTRVQYLERLLEPSTVAQVTEIKRGLKSAHRGLEKLQGRCDEDATYIVVIKATRETWQTYRKLVKLEEKLCAMKNGQVLRKRDRNAQSPATYVPTGARLVERGRRTVKESGRKAAEEKPRRSMSGTIDYTGPNGAALEEGGCMSHCPSEVAAGEAVASKIIVVANGDCIRTSSQLCKASVDESSGKSTILYNSPRNVRKRGPLSPILLRSRQEVLESVTDEELRETIELRDPDRQRHGSADGFTITDMILCGRTDPTFIIPVFDCIKIHEVKALKQWLSDMKYVKRSGTISRIEKVLHLLFVLQMGCRLETMAVVFSRTPREVESSLKEVFEGLLEMHSETMLPETNDTYRKLWHIGRRFNTPENSEAAQQYYPWTLVDLCKVLVTLNVYIGRWRKQGRFALDGPYLRWGKYLDAEEDSGEDE